MHPKWGLSRRRGSEQKDREPSQAFANNTGVDVVVVVVVVVPDKIDRELQVLGEDADEPLVIAPHVAYGESDQGNTVQIAGVLPARQNGSNQHG